MNKKQLKTIENFIKKNSREFLQKVKINSKNEQYISNDNMFIIFKNYIPEFELIKNEKEVDIKMNNLIATFLSNNFNEQNFGNLSEIDRFTITHVENYIKYYEEKFGKDKVISIVFLNNCIDARLLKKFLEIVNFDIKQTKFGKTKNMLFFDNQNYYGIMLCLRTGICKKNLKILINYGGHKNEQ